MCSITVGPIESPQCGASTTCKPFMLLKLNRATAAFGRATKSTNSPLSAPFSGLLARGSLFAAWACSRLAVPRFKAECMTPLIVDSLFWAQGGWIRRDSHEQDTKNRFMQHLHVTRIHKVKLQVLSISVHFWEPGVAAVSLSHDLGSKPLKRDGWSRLQCAQAKSASV